MKWKGKKFSVNVNEFVESIPREETVMIVVDINGHVGEGNTSDTDMLGKVW